ncbi:MAG: hypothetical protein HOO94_04085 [Novosphingobium sp.]|uniref:hypothetical protein n=1 Tax=Novosphingobium sp. TaxID=1874826 RepID=UPI0018351524|nr:hypothetical protein [Novosphingobium sp.]
MSDNRLLMLEAIARKRTIAASYNGQRIVLAPHLLYERHGDQYVAALNFGKVWRSDEAPRLGQFKLAGLASAELLDESFEPLTSFDGAVPREGDVAILAV